MAITMQTPDAAGLTGALAVLGEWQEGDASGQLHPGDVGWFWRFGAEATAAAVRTWSRDGRVLAVALLDGSRLARLATAPDVRDAELAEQLSADLADPSRGVLPAGEVDVEAPAGALVQELLADQAWETAEPWTPLRRDLAGPVEVPRVRAEVVGPGHVRDRVAVQRAAFERSTFTVERWGAMAQGPAYADARCLVAHDADRVPVAAITVWSAGPGRPGLIEPMGVHPDHRGRGHGTAITLAGAAALRELGSSSAVVVTPSTLTGAVATYRAAGFEPLAQTHDLRRPA